MSVRFTTHNTRSRPASSIISNVDYFVAEERLVVMFHSGKTYQYFKVPKSVIKEWLRAESVGSFFVNNIKNGPYDYEEIGD